uniref:Endonuclease/exonuclease/phosphatase domain-containing protein n=1 Tax=Aegilops tauschii subsp. strangulata TaxID=200361 RepID=A0A453JT70_AEGTS
MIMQASDKSNTNLDRRMMHRFRQFVDGTGLKELFLHGRKFTWSNEREAPTLTKIDRALVSVDWEMEHPDCLLQALSTASSDHCPLHLALHEHLHPHRRFRFELFWTKLEGFEDAVREAWQCDPEITDPFKRIDLLLRNTARFLTAWGQKKTGNVKLLIVIANWVIFQLDVAQERRRLSEGERWLRRTLKLTTLGLASLKRT